MCCCSKLNNKLTKLTDPFGQTALWSDSVALKSGRDRSLVCRHCVAHLFKPLIYVAKSGLRILHTHFHLALGLYLKNT